VIRYVRAGDDKSQNIVVLFDPWGARNVQKPAFGESLFTGLGVDVITVQKRDGNWFQDLSIECFSAAALNVLSQYERKVFFGSSLGGYAALYFSTICNGDVLAMSPILRNHPLYLSYSGNRYAGIPFRHKEMRELITGNAVKLVIYDPLDAGDNAYAKHEIEQVFSDVYFCKVRHTGHPVTATFKEAGVLKRIAVAFVMNGVIPSRADIVTALKANSWSYLHSLARHCYYKRHFNWAYSINERAMALISPNASMHRLRANLLIRSGDLTGARDAIEQAIILAPTVASHKIALAELLHSTGEIADALASANDAIELRKKASDHKLRLIILSESGDQAAVESAIDAAAGLFPGDLGIVTISANLALAGGNPSKALAIIRQIKADDPSRRRLRKIEVKAGAAIALARNVRSEIA
jgi:Flp pilus assembly protein TadD